MWTTPTYNSKSWVDRNYPVESKKQNSSDSEKLFLVTFEISNPQSDYYTRYTVKGKDAREARRAAEFFICDFFGVKTKMRKRGVYMSLDETETIKVDTVEEVTAETLANRLLIHAPSEKKNRDEDQPLSAEIPAIKQTSYVSLSL